MKIVSYNLFEGANETTAALEEFVNNEYPDVVCLQEANGWGDDNERRAKEFAEKTGLSHWIYGDSNTRFKLATFSRFPFVNSTVHKDGLWHSAIQAGVRLPDNNVAEIWNIHHNPRNEDDRIREAKKLTSIMGTKALIMGDFNSLSRSDDYDPGLVKQLNAKNIQKFGETALRFDVMDLWDEQGLTDIALHLGANIWTVPTPANKDLNHADRLRLDYMLATPSLLPSIVSLATPKNDLTDKISDHYPLVAIIK